MTDRVGQQLGNYRLLKLIGHGSFAEIYLGEHQHLNTQAAIKVLNTHFTSEDKDRFYAEARTIARLTHPHIVRILDFSTSVMASPFSSWSMLLMARCGSATRKAQECP